MISEHSNVFYLQKTLAEISTLTTEALGFKVTIKHAYKICDIRIAFGVVFADLLKDYDFWGYGDIDVIFGNIRNFYTDELLTQYDVFSGREAYLSGFLTLFRNTPFINRLYEKSKDYKFVFQSDKNYAMDETNYWYWKIKENKSILTVESEIESLTHVVKKLDANREIRAFFDHLVVEGVPGKLEWKKGNLYYNDKYEILLYHLIQMKDHLFLLPPMWRNIPDHYYINEFFFSEYSPLSEPGKDQMKQIQENIARDSSLKIEKYCNLKHATPSDSTRNTLLNFCGTYKSIFHTAIDELLIFHISLKEDYLCVKFGENIVEKLFYLEGNNYLLVSPTLKAEVLFTYDPTQSTQTLTLLQIGYILPIKLHKQIDTKDNLYYN